MAIRSRHRGPAAYELRIVLERIRLLYDNLANALGDDDRQRELIAKMKVDADAVYKVAHVEALAPRWSRPSRPASGVQFNESHMKMRRIVMSVTSRCSTGRTTVGEAAEASTGFSRRADRADTRVAPDRSHAVS